MVCESDPKTGYCDTGWIFSSEFNSKMSPSEVRSRTTPASQNSKNQQQGRINSLGKSLNLIKTAQVNEISALTVIPIHYFFLHKILTYVYSVGALDYYVVSIKSKNGQTYSCLTYIYTHCVHLSSEISMHHFHYLCVNFSLCSCDDLHRR